MAEIGKWLPILIDHSCGDPDFSDSEKVLGWLGASLSGDVLTVNYEPDKDAPGGLLAPASVERY